ncbi:MAG: hypothetical protein AAF849_13235 [Bacteroidota bacterium]
MDDGYTYDRIEDYLEDRLSKEAKAKFEAQLAVDDALRKELTFYRHLQLATQRLEQEEDFRKTIQGVDQTLDENAFFKASAVSIDKNKGKSDRKLWIPLSVAAGLLVLLWLGGRYWGQSYYSNAVLAENFEPFEIVSTDRGDGIKTENQLQKGIDAFEAKSYADAIEWFSSTSEADAFYVQSQYYLAHTYLAQQKYDAAIEQFQKVADTKSTLYKDRAEWYQLQAMLLSESAQETLNEQLDKILSNPNHGYLEKAQALKQQVNSIWRQF